MADQMTWAQAQAALLEGKTIRRPVWPPADGDGEPAPSCIPRLYKVIRLSSELLVTGKGEAPATIWRNDIESMWEVEP